MSQFRDGSTGGSYGFKRNYVRVLQAFLMVLGLLPITVATAQEDPESALNPPYKESELAPGEELKELRTSNSRTVMGDNGSLQAQVYPGPVHYREDGEWEPIDNSLVPSDRPGYAFENAANSFKVLIPQDIGVMPIRVETGEEWVTYSLEGASGSPSVSGEVATFEDTMSGVDLAYTVLGSGVREDLELASPSTPDVYNFEVEMSAGVKAQQDADRSVSFTDQSSGEEFFFAPPVMFEADSGAASAAISQEIEEGSSTTDDFTLVLDPSDKWLESDQREYPVILDPEWVSGASDQMRSCWIGNGAGETNQSYCYQDEIRAGYDDPNNAKRRASIQFNLPTTILASAVTDAKLRMCVTARSTTAVVNMKAYQLTENSTHQATWIRRNVNAQGNNVLWTNAGGTYRSETTDPTQDVGGGIGKYESWDLDASVGRWLDGSQPNHGLILKTGEGTNQVMRFASFDYPSSGGAGVTTNCTDGKKPRLTIEYNHAPDVPASLSPAAGTVTNDSTPTLSATYDDPDSGDTGYTEFEVFDASGLFRWGRSPASSDNPSNVSPGTSVSWSSTNPLTTEATYSWKARNCDGARCSAWSSLRELTFDVTPPNVELTEPGPDRFLDGTATLSASADDASGIFKVEFLFDADIVGVDHSAPFTYGLDTTAYEDGDYDVQARAFDQSGEVATTAVTVTSIDNESVGEPDGELQDLALVAQQEGITLDEAIQRYGWQDSFVEAANDIQDDYPDDFAGAAISETGEASVVFSDTAPPEAVEITEDLPVDVDLIENRGFTESEVNEELKDVYFETYDHPMIADAGGTYDIETGDVLVEALPEDAPLDPMEEQQLEEELEPPPPPNPAIDVEVSVVQELNQSEDEFMRGGAFLNDSGCTAGFTVRNVNNGHRGISTAEHCADGFYNIFETYYNHAADGASTTIERKSMHSGRYGDIAWYDRGNYTPKPRFYYRYNEHRHVTRIRWAVPGQTLCNYGRTTGAKCERVYRLNECSSGACDLVAMHRNANAGGDSGGPWYWGHNAYGIHHGTKRIWGFVRALFTPVTNLRDALGVVVLIRH